MMIKKSNRKHILKRAFLLLIVFLLLSVCLGGCLDRTQAEYLVLIGEDSSVVEQIENTDLLVIDAEYFSSGDLVTLKEQGVEEIFTYFNIGSLENFRDYFEEYCEYTLGDYENWPEEKWMDISREEWQDFLKKRVLDFKNKGVDGLFVDNTDVYAEYPTEEIYEGIIDVLRFMRDSGMKIIINGGDIFVKRYMEDYPEDSIFDGVNQEGVYTSYDFDTQTCDIGTEETRKYYEEYLSTVLGNGYSVYLVEYATDHKIREDVISYAKTHKYTLYLSDNIELKLESASCQ